MQLNCPMPKFDFDVITLGHGSGGLLTHKLLESGVYWRAVYLIYSKMTCLISSMTGPLFLCPVTCHLVQTVMWLLPFSFRVVILVTWQLTEL